MNALTTNRLNKVIILEAIDLAKSTNSSISRVKSAVAKLGVAAKSITLSNIALCTAAAAGIGAYAAAIIGSSAVVVASTAVAVVCGSVVLAKAPKGGAQ